MTASTRFFARVTCSGIVRPALTPPVFIGAMQGFGFFGLPAFALLLPLLAGCIVTDPRPENALAPQPTRLDPPWYPPLPTYKSHIMRVFIKMAFR